MKSGLTAGVSLVDISPGPGIELAGYPHHPRNNKGIHDPLFAGCICLDDRTTKLALVCMDLAIYPKAEVRAVREAATRLTGIPAGNILISCSHTHSGPWTSAMSSQDVLGMSWRVDEEYVAALRGRLIDLVRRASESSFEAFVGIGKGFCGREQGVGGNRRDPLGLADPEVWTIGVKDLSGSLRACLAKYTLHPTFLHSDNFLVSADYPGCIREHLGRAKPGMTLLFAQGCSGNQSPRYFRSGKTYDEAKRVGYAIGTEAARVLDSLEYRREARLACRSTEVEVELRKLPPRREAEEAVARARSEWERLKATSTVERDVWNAELRFLGAENILSFVMIQERAPGGRLTDPELPAEVQVLGIGNSRIVGLPGEIFVEFGMTIQYRAPFEQCFVIELANGHLPGYACTAQAYAGGGYETGASLLTGRSGEQLVEAAVRLLRETSGE